MTEAEFDAFYDASFPRLVGQLHAMCGSLTEAQDCVQEAFIRAWDHRGALDRDRSPEGWVRTAAYRLSVSHWRRRRRTTVGLADEALGATTSGSSTAAVDRVAVQRALAQLKPEQRRVIVLHHLCDLSVADIAAEIGAPTGTVKARLSRARAALAPLLDETREGVNHA